MNVLVTPEVPANEINMHKHGQVITCHTGNILHLRFLKM